jgi:hypothetical protein
MGLDMDLTRKIYIGAEYEHNQVEGKIELTRKGKSINIDLRRLKNIEESVAYWRKANHIHKWFVDNVQDGEDDCGTYYVSKEKLKQLYEICLEILKNPKKAPELMPTQEGFFFGSTDYDEYYMTDIKDTIEQLKPIFREDKLGKILDDDIDDMSEYYYHSSW